MFLAASALESDIACLREDSPQLWRQLRRFNLPVQLALAAAHRAAAYSHDPARAALVSLAPCQAGSPQLHRQVQKFVEDGLGSVKGNFRMNPILTLHAVDNLALSAFAMAKGNQAYCLGLGGAAGQAWCGVEAALEVISEGLASEVLLLSGDQQDACQVSAAQGAALLFSAHSRLHPALGRTVKLRGLSRRPGAESLPVQPHAAAGLAAFLADLGRRVAAASLGANGAARFRYAVPWPHTDGVDRVSISLEVS